MAQYEYTIGDSVVTSDKQLTDAEIDEIAAKHKIAGVAARAKVGTGEYLVDSLKKGPGDAMDFISTITQFLDPGRVFDLANSPRKTLGEVAAQSGEARKPIDEFFGVRNVAPDNDIAQIAGAGASALTNPMSAIGPAKSGVVLNILKSVFPSMTAEGMRDMAEKMGAGPFWQFVASIGGGAVGGVVQSGATRIGRTGIEAAKAMKGGGLKDAAFSHLTSQAEQHVRNTIRAAMENDPNILQELIKLQNNAAAAGVQLPIHTIGNNTVIKSAIAKLAARDPLFAGIYAREYEKALASLTEHKNSLFGNPVEAKGKFEAGLGATKATQKTRIDSALDERAFKAGEKIAPAYNERTLSGQLTNLFENSEGPADISPRSIPEYQRARKLAEQNKDALSPQSVQKVWETVQGSKEDSLFKQFPALWERIQKNLNPTNVNEEAAYPKLNYEDTEKLKEAVSLEYRRLSKSDPDYWSKRAELTKVRHAIDEGIKSDFNPLTRDSLKAADSQYAFDFTLRDMGRSVFNDKGILDPSKLKAWLLDPNNRKAVQNITDLEGQTLRDITQNPAIAVAKIMEKKDSVNGIYQRMYNQHLLDAAQMTPQQIVNNLYSSDKFVTQFLNKYGKTPEVKRALQSFLLDDVVNSKEPLVTLLNDKNKASVYNRVFGPGFAKQVEDIADLAGKLKKNPGDVGFDFTGSIDKDIVQEKINIPAAQVFSKLRNPIISKWQALVELGSRALTEHAQNAYEHRMKQILLDPKAFEEYVRAVRPAAGTDKVNPQPLLDWAKKWAFGEAQRTGSNVVKGAVAGAVQGTAEDKAE